ncbi:MAG: oxygen-independent coproporphyrinogen III oxidase-like protein [Rubrivivax sp.]|nr:oxygen-independent coproporphyrinogen III oxidase-like protein [Rubrivivax sp.]
MARASTAAGAPAACERAVNNDERVAAPAPAADLAHLMRAGTLQLPALPPLSLYVHLPWCLKKCPYCDFNSHATEPAALPQARYLEALVADLDAALPLVWGRPVHTVFIGGGTPSLFSPEGIDRLLAAVRSRLPLVPGAEVTLEANPGTFERERFRAYRAAGVTRLSVGVQTFDDALLARIGRVHDGAQARAAVEEAAAAFDTFNIDLMYALPGQEPAALRADLDIALAFAPPHLSAYHLTLEPNTAFAANPPPLPDEDLASDMLDLLTQRLGAAGLERYEVSAFARPGHRCRHNLNYWQFGDYLGIGAGAHGKLSFAHRIVRQVRWREPARYMQEALSADARRTVSNQHEVGRADLPFEFMVNQLRLAEGFELARWRERTGLPLSAIEAALAEGERRGLLAIDGEQVRATARGFDFLSDLQALFLPARKKAPAV